MSEKAVARLHLEMASQRELVQLARLVVSGVATVSKMDLEGVEDCRAAVDEMCSSLMERSAPETWMSLDIETDGATLEVTGSIDVAGSAGPDEVRLEISEMILDAVTDEHEMQIDDTTGRAAFRFTRTTRTSRADGDAAS